MPSPPVSARVGDEGLFVQLAEHIRSRGYEGTFYRMKITYDDEDGPSYWTMGAPVEETIIINRCKKEFALVNIIIQRLENGKVVETWMSRDKGHSRPRHDRGQDIPGAVAGKRKGRSRLPRP